MINKILLILLLLLSLNLIREYVLPGQPVLQVPVAEENMFSAESDSVRSWQYYAAVLGDNARVDAAVSLPELPFVLRGTMIASPQNSFAVFEDKTTGRQELYSLGAEVYGAKIVALARNRVTVDDGSSKYTLGPDGEIVSQSRRYGGRLARRSIFGNGFSAELPQAAEAEVARCSIDFAKLLTQMRIKPYFVDGKCIGFQLARVYSNSIIEKTGLKEGDIIFSINGMAVDDPLKAMKSLYSLDANGPLHLGVERQDERFEMDCRLES